MDGRFLLARMLVVELAGTGRDGTGRDLRLGLSVENRDGNGDGNGNVGV